MINIGIDGTAIKKAIDQYAAQIKRNVRAGVGQAGLMVAAEAKRRAPVDTERLRNSIASRVETEGGDVVAKIGTNVEYAIHVEFGHRTRLGKGKVKSSLVNRTTGAATVHVVPGKYFLYGALNSKKDQAARLIIAAITKKTKG